MKLRNDLGEIDECVIMYVSCLETASAAAVFGGHIDVSG